MPGFDSGYHQSQEFFSVMEKVLQGIPNVVAYLDDIMASSPTEEEHVKLLDKILG